MEVGVLLFRRVLFGWKFCYWCCWLCCVDYLMVFLFVNFGWKYCLEFVGGCWGFEGDDFIVVGLVVF